MNLSKDSWHYKLYNKMTWLRSSKDSDTPIDGCRYWSIVFNSVCWIFNLILWTTLLVLGMWVQLLNILLYTAIMVIVAMLFLVIAYYVKDKQTVKELYTAYKEKYCPHIKWKN